MTIKMAATNMSFRYAFRAFIHWGFVTFCIVLIVLVTSVMALAQTANSPESASKESVSNLYKFHRNTFISKKQAQEVRFHNESRELEEKIQKIQQDIKRKNEEITTLHSHIDRVRTKMALLEGISAGICSFFFPVATISSFFSIKLFGLGINYILLFIFIPVTAINLYIYLWRRERIFFKKYFVVLTIFLIILLGTFVSPLLAAQNDKRNEIGQTLDEVSQVLSQSDYQRFIAILEARVNHWITLPALSSGDPLLHVFRRVSVDSPEYYFTLAALCTHEGQNGKAVDAIMNIAQKKDLRSSKNHDQIIINSIKFLVENQQLKPAGTAVENLGPTIQDMKSLLRLADYLNAHEMQPSSKKILDIAIIKAKSVDALVELSRYFYEKKDPNKASAALLKALRASKNINDILLIANEAILQKNDHVIKKVAEEVPFVTYRISEYFQLVDVFLNNGRKENAAAIVDNMISKIKSSTSNYRSKLLAIIDETLRRNLLEQTIRAVNKLSMYMGEKAYDFRINEHFSLKSAEGLPNTSYLTLPVFYGLLNEELSFIDKAEDVYILATIASLKKILKSYGYNLPESLNEYYLLGRIWLRTDKEELLSHLDEVYTTLEIHLLKQLEKKNKALLKEKRKKLALLEDEYSALVQEKQTLRSTLSEERKKLIFTALHTVSLTFFVLAIIAGCLIKSSQYSKGLSSQKTYGFLTKFIEVSGWIRIMSILAIPSGLAGVFIAQLMQLPQQIHEQVFKLSHVERPELDYGRKWRARISQ